MHPILNKIKLYIQVFLIEIGDLSYFAGRFFKEVFKSPFEFREFLRQCYQMGNRSLLLVSVTGFIIGLVFYLAITSYVTRIWSSFLDAFNGKYFNY